MKVKMTTLLASAPVLLMNLTAYAQDDALCLEGEVCCLNPENAFAKIAVFAVPLVILGVFGFFLSQKFGKDAATAGTSTAAAGRAGWAWGAFFAALSFAGVVAAATTQSVVDGAACSIGMADGYGMLSVILIVITFLLAIVMQIQRK